MRVIGWMGRMFVWAVFAPLGLVLSIRRGKHKRHAELMKAVQSQQMQTASKVNPQEYRGDRINPQSPLYSRISLPPENFKTGG